MYKSKAELRRERMIGVMYKGVTFIAEPEHLKEMGLLHDDTIPVALGEFDHSAWVGVNNLKDDTDFGIHSTDMASLIAVCKMLRDLEAFVTGPLKDRVVDFTVLQRSIERITATPESGGGSFEV